VDFGVKGNIPLGGVEITGYMQPLLSPPMLLAFLKEKMYFTAATLSVNYNQTQTYKSFFCLKRKPKTIMFYTLGNLLFPSDLSLC
jgi:hypothetical protein